MSNATASRTPTRVRVEIPQYSRAGVLALWAAAAVPMGLLAWVVAPAIAGGGSTRQHFTVTLLGALTAGLMWQCLLVLAVVGWEQRTVRPSRLRAALWLRAPTDRRRRGGRLWWWALPTTLVVAVLEEVLSVDPDGPANRSFGLILGSCWGQDLFRGNWSLFGLAVVQFAFNTVLGEELLFRGLLLPRMRGAFGRADWVVNALLFAGYHLHQPWSMPSALTTGLVMAHATKRWQSAWFGIIAHSAQSVFFTVILLELVSS
ncbi:MAG: lysostaphin resistance A-like protein [Kineosporiaceae bacterium]